MSVNRELLGDPVTLTPERRRIILDLAQADGQPWAEDQMGSGWNDHMGEYMYGQEADVVERHAARAQARVVAAVQTADTWAEVADVVHQFLPRPWTPHEVHADGSKTLHVKRCCDGCGHEVGDVTEAELKGAVSGRPLPSVIDEHGCQA